MMRVFFNTFFRFARNRKKFRNESENRINVQPLVVIFHHFHLFGYISNHMNARAFGGKQNNKKGENK
ncbi:MAG TPA: hypothetical protein DD611_01380 [Alphaproteobacteria bacterium]|nr:hypothetical protein [Alphaproteobacteria bacterium]